jgi:hypothetical protein
MHNFTTIKVWLIGRERCTDGPLVMRRINRWVIDIEDNCLFVCLIGFYITPSQYRLYCNIPALLVEEDLRCPSVRYFRYKQAPE